MKKYFAEIYMNLNGQYEIHKELCKVYREANKSKFMPIGEYLSSKDAIKENKNLLSERHYNGCKYCCPDIHECC